MSKQLRVLYAAGPGDVIGTYHYWINGEDDPSQVAVTYSAQFYDVCSDLNAQGYIISSFTQKGFLRDGRFTIEHRPVIWRSKSGLLYHFGQIWYGLRLIISAMRFQADVVFVVEGSTHLFVMTLLPYLGIEVVPVFQCVLWPEYQPPSKVNQLIWRLSHNLLEKSSFAIVVISDTITKQISQITGSQHKPIYKTLPYYRRDQFSDIKKPCKNRSLFYVLYAGRIEINKGVFDLLKIAIFFASSSMRNIKFDVCGKGSELENLKSAAKEAKVDSFFICHGHCDKLKMKEMFNRAHVVIAPTRTSFVEGLNKVVIEGVLSGRPVITSAVCPSFKMVENAVLEVPPNDLGAYREAILKLYYNREYYESKCQSCLKLQEKFYSYSNSWAATLTSILTKINVSSKLKSEL